MGYGFDRRIESVGELLLGEVIIAAQFFQVFFEANFHTNIVSNIEKNA